MIRRAVLALTLVAAVAGCGGEETAPDLPYHRWHEPERAGAEAGGVVLALHGGSWVLTGEEGAATVRPVVAELTEQGHTVLNGSYAAGADGLPDVEALYELAKERADGPVCVYGQSAGGYWALELAIRHHDVACVVAEAPPTDLEALRRSSEGLADLVTRVFGADLRAHSPIRGPFSPSTRILIAGVTDDPLVPWAQARRFRRAWPQTELVPLRPGGVPWIHASADAASIRGYERARERLLSASLRRGRAEAATAG